MSDTGSPARVFSPVVAEGTETIRLPVSGTQAQKELVIFT